MPLHFSALRAIVKKFLPAPMRQIPVRLAARKLGFYMEGWAWYTIIIRPKGRFASFLLFCFGGETGFDVYRRGRRSEAAVPSCAKIGNLNTNANNEVALAA